MTGPGDLGGLLHLVACLVAGRSISTQSNHASCETGQVTHLMLQKTPLPLGYVGQPAARLPHQVGFYCLKDKIKKKKKEEELSVDASMRERTPSLVSLSVIILLRCICTFHFSFLLHTIIKVTSLFFSLFFFFRNHFK